MDIKLYIILFPLILFSQYSFSFGNDLNITIYESEEWYEFTWDESQNKILVKEELRNYYRCDKYGATILIHEFYNDEITIEKVNFSIDGKKPKHIEPEYSYYHNDDEYFFSDIRICFFELPLKHKGSTCSVSFTKTISDPRYFYSIFFTQDYPVVRKKINIKVPRWITVKLKEINFNGCQISRSVRYSGKDNADIYTYVMENLPEMQEEDNCPGPGYIYPHILVLPEQATIGNINVAYFKTVDDLYKWYKQLLANDESDSIKIRSLARQITEGKNNDIDKIKAVFYWVQNNIRYLAFENGVAGFRPDKADEVIRKRYGDCKGMANITRHLLKALGYDARLCWIGTNHIAYDYSTPSIAVDNHMICALNFHGKMYFLDATESCLGFNEYAERIQGRQCLVENGDTYLLTNIPFTTHTQNRSEEKITLSIDGTGLKGKVSGVRRGEEKERMLWDFHHSKKNESMETLIKYLSNNNKACVITDLRPSDLDNFDQSLETFYTVEYQHAVDSFDKDYYIDLDWHKEFNHFEFDTLKRQFDYWFPCKQDIHVQTELMIPMGYHVKSLPAALEIKNDHYEFAVAYQHNPDKITYTKNLILKDIKITRSMFTQWNKDIQQLDTFYANQIVLTKK